MKKYKRLQLADPMTESEHKRPEMQLWSSYAEVSRTYQSQDDFVSCADSDCSPYQKPDAIPYHVWEQAIREALENI